MSSNCQSDKEFTFKFNYWNCRIFDQKGINKFDNIANTKSSHRPTMCLSQVTFVKGKTWKESWHSYILVMYVQNETQYFEMLLFDNQWTTQLP